MKATSCQSIHNRPRRIWVREIYRSGHAQGKFNNLVLELRGVTAESITFGHKQYNLFSASNLYENVPKTWYFSLPRQGVFVVSSQSQTAILFVDIAFSSR